MQSVCKIQTFAQHSGRKGLDMNIFQIYEKLPRTATQMDRPPTPRGLQQRTILSPPLNLPSFSLTLSSHQQRNWLRENTVFVKKG